ncbi:MAG: hypothetical protein M3136_05205 [Thermoproteota archaeon]|nr:hypothetical protein [Thermoproteota archaeon]
MNEFEGWQKILSEWREVNRMKRLNQELYDLLGGAIIYIMEYAEKNDIHLPNQDALYRMADRIHYLMGEIEPSSTSDTHSSTPKNDTPEDDRTIIIIAASIYIVRSCYRLGILSYVSTMSYGDDLYSIALGID